MRKLVSPKHSFLATHILQEVKKNSESDFADYINILPKILSEYPIFFTTEEKQWLKGSPFLNQVEERIE